MIRISLDFGEGEKRNENSNSKACVYTCANNKIMKFPAKKVL